MRVLLFGATGMLGSDLVRFAPSHAQITAPSHRDLNISDAAALSAALDDLRPDIVLNAAGFTSVEDAELAAREAMLVNGDAVTRLGQLSAQRGISVVHFSTDYVFDGRRLQPYREDDPTAPLNAYGESKVAGEQGLIASDARALIVRTQWLFGERGFSFPRTMLERAERRVPTTVVSDQWGRPTSTVDMSRLTWSLISRGAVGIFHAANAGTASWFDVAAHVFEYAGKRPLLTPCSSEQFPSLARRPLRSVLDTSKVERFIGNPLRHWTSALDELLHRIAPSSLQV
jgi:dTDP-4-dehydrorhamnose reductase